MNTVWMTGVGVVFSAMICTMMAIAFALGYAEPNVIPEAGETYLGWWLMLIGTTVGAGTIWGLIFDAVGMIQYFFKKNS